MATKKGFITGYSEVGGSNNYLSVSYCISNSSGDFVLNDDTAVVSHPGTYTSNGLRDAIVAAVKAAALTYHSTTLADSDIIMGFAPGVAWENVYKTFANPSRSLNSAFQISTLRDALVSYTVDVAATLSLTTGQAGTVALKYADDSGMTTNVVTVQSSVNGNSGTLALGLGLTQTATAALGGVIPAGKYVELVTTNTTGTPTFTMRAGQEVLI